MATVADNIAELMRIKLEQRNYFGIGKDVPFAQYIDIMKWAGHEVPQQPLYADFVNQMYAKDGKPCRFEDIFELIRLSKAWQFEHGKLEEYDVNEPRFSGKGLLIEPESTNYVNYSDDIYNSYWLKSASIELVSAGNGWVSVSTASSSNTVSLSVRNIYDANVVSANYVTRSLYHIENNNVNNMPFGFRNRLDARLTGSGIMYNPVERSVTDLDDVEFVHQHTDRGVSMIGFTSKVAEKDTGYFIRNSSGVVGKIIVIGGAQVEFGEQVTSFIKTTASPVTRLPETLTVLTGANLTIEADEGIQVNGNEITGFGYIRKLEVK